MTENRQQPVCGMTMAGIVKENMIINVKIDYFQLILMVAVRSMEGNA
jgi:hypothetical protein